VAKQPFRPVDEIAAQLLVDAAFLALQLLSQITQALGRSLRVSQCARFQVNHRQLLIYLLDNRQKSIIASDLFLRFSIQALPCLPWFHLPYWIQARSHGR
jgi:hypothetical protein